MLLLTATTETIKLLTGGAGTVDVHVSYADITATAFTPGSAETQITTAAATTIISAPAASTQRQVKLITVRNNHTDSQTVTVQKDISGTVRVLTPDVVLAAGEVLQYLDGQGFSVLDPFAQRKVRSDATIANPPGVNSEWSMSDREGLAALQDILLELKVISMILADGFGGHDEPSKIRELINQ